jgi:hypothetical protein
MNYSMLNAIVYDVLWRFCDSYPSLRANKLVQMVMTHCFPDWVLWKTEITMKDVDTQAETLKEQWQKEDNEKVVEKVSKLFPDAKVTTHDEKTGAVLIEHPPDGSKAQGLLGGTMEIRSPWSLPEDE